MRGAQGPLRPSANSKSISPRLRHGSAVASLRAVLTREKTRNVRGPTRVCASLICIGNNHVLDQARLCHPTHYLCTQCVWTHRQYTRERPACQLGAFAHSFEVQRAPKKRQMFAWWGGNSRRGSVPACHFCRAVSLCSELSHTLPGVDQTRSARVCLAC